MLDREGVPAAEAMRRLIGAIGKQLVLSDEPTYDSHWLALLAEAANVEPIKLGDARAVIREAAIRNGTAYGEIEQQLPVQHRAEADARRLASMYMRAAAICEFGTDGTT